MEYEVRSSDLWEGTRFTIQDGADEGTGFTMDGPMAVYGKPSVLLSMADLNASSRGHLQRMGGRTFREVLHPGAFAKSLAESPDVVLLTQHNENGIPLGRTKAGTLRLTEEAGMVRAQADLPDNELGRPVRDAVRRGDLGGLSYRHGKVIENWKTETLPDGYTGPVRHVHEIQLRREISLVTFPGFDTPTAIRQLAEEADLEPDALASAFEALRTPDAKLTDEQHHLLQTAIASKVEEPFMDPKLVQKRQALDALAATVAAAAG